jgi:hypothetical protein
MQTAQAVQAASPGTPMVALQQAIQTLRGGKAAAAVPITAAPSPPPPAAAAVTPPPAPAPQLPAPPPVQQPAVTTQAQQPTPPPPLHPDIVSGGVTKSYPGDPNTYYVAHALPTPTGGDYSPEVPNYAPRLQTAQLLAAVDPAKSMADIRALQAEQTAQQLKANANKAAFDAGEKTRVMAQYDKELESYNTAGAAAQAHQNAKEMEAIHQTGQEASSQLARNAEVLKTYGNARDAGIGAIASLDQAAPLLQSLPEGAGSMLMRNDTTREWLEHLGLAGTSATGADLFNQVMERSANLMSPLAPAGTEKANQFAHYRTQLASLSQSPEGRELAIAYARDFAQNQVESMNWLTMNKEAQPYMSDRLKVPDYDKAVVGLQTQGPQMPRMPPIPSTFTTRQFTEQDKAKQFAFQQTVQPGQSYYAWLPGDDGRMHARKYQMQLDVNGKAKPVPLSMGGG